MRIIFAGGGTAGHVNPAIATANYIGAREDSQVWLSGGRGNIEERLAQKAGLEIFAFPLHGLKRGKSPKALAHNVAALGQTAAALVACRGILRRLRPDIVVGTGGYASFPMVSAAVQLGVPTAILEVNAAPGMVTRRLAAKVGCVMTAYAETAQRLPDAREVVQTGAPVRQEILDARDKAFEPIFQNGLPMVVCFWGSVGAQYMNEKMIGFAVRCAREGRFNLLYAAGESHLPRVRAGLEAAGIDPTASGNIDLRAYIDDMDRALALSSLVICRGGGSLMELCAVGRGSIIVPSPWVTDNHQEKNARAMEAAGAAMVVTEAEATADGLYEQTLALLADRQALARMGQAAARRAQPQALEQIYTTLKRIAASPGGR